MRRAAVLLLFLLLPATGQADRLDLDALFLEGRHDGPDLPEPLWIEEDEAFLLRADAQGDGEAVYERVEPRSGRAREWIRLRLPGAPRIDDLRVAPGERWLLARTAGRPRWRDSTLHDHWLVRRDSRETTRLSEEGGEIHARFSPDGRRLAWVRDGDLYLRDLQEGTTRRLTEGGGALTPRGDPDWVYEEEFGLDAAWWWSPDGARILYLATDARRIPRRPVLRHRPEDGEEFLLLAYPRPGDPNSDVELRVLDVEDGLDSRVDGVGSEEGYLPLAGWLPGGEGVWWIRLDRRQQHLQLRVAAPGGEPRTLLEERSEAWVDVLDGPRFLDDHRRFLWRSRRDGWVHVYLYDLEGRLHRQLTRGDWNVRTIVHVSPGHAVLLSDREDPTRRRVERLALPEGTLERMDEEDGWHALEASPTGSYLLDTVSSASRRPALLVRDGDGRRLRALAQDPMEDLREVELAAVTFLTLTAEDGSPMPASMLLPPGMEPVERHAALVYCYGGPGSQLVRDRWGGATGLFHRFLAQEGFLVLSVDGRGSATAGLEHEQRLDRRLGTLEIEDQAAAIEFLRRLPYVDPERIAIWGWSYGGYVAIRTTLRHPELVSAGIAVAPVTDWRLYDSVYTERYLDLPSLAPEGYDRGSLLEEAARLERPLLLLHGLADDKVHVQHTLRLAKSLQEAQRPFEMMLYPDRAHGILGKAARRNLYGQIHGFLLRTLGSAVDP